MALEERAAILDARIAAVDVEAILALIAGAWKAELRIELVLNALLHHAERELAEILLPPREEFQGRSNCRQALRQAVKIWKPWHLTCAL